MIDNSELLEALPVAVFTTDADGHITSYNDAAAALWGYRPELGSLWYGSLRLFWPDARPLTHDQCPMAIALKEGRKVRGVEAIVERPDGSRVPLTAFATPIKDSSGRVTGGINVLVESADRKLAETMSAHFAAIVSSSDDAIISKTLEGQITSWNPGATTIFGYEEAEMIGQNILRVIPPELHDEEKQILSRLSRGEHIGHYETVRVAKSGRRVDISLTVSPLYNEAGIVIGASKIARDVTERKQAEKLQRLLMEELNHRVKNTLATVQAIAVQSSQYARSQSDFLASFTGRVQALAKAHNLLTQTKMQGAELGEIIREQVLLGNHDDRRIAMSGPLVLLDSQAAVHLALVLHELATNARKYGALSQPGGRLTVVWDVRASDTRLLTLAWRETGGPRVSVPQTRGFGTTLIEQTLRGHEGEVTMHYAEDGLTCQIRLPLPIDAPEIAATHSPVPGGRLLEADNDSNVMKNKNILVIEDEPLLAMDLEATLLSLGCKVIGPAATVEHARRLIREKDFDVALLDVNLGGQPVDDLAAALAQKNIPFAFVTGYGRKALPQAFQEAVMMSKPFSQAQLVATVETLVYLGRPRAAVVPLRQIKV